MRTKRKGASVQAPYVIDGFWLRGLDLNQRPLGYEPKVSTLSPVESVALTRFTSSKNTWSEWILHASCTVTGKRNGYALHFEVPIRSQRPPWPHRQKRLSTKEPPKILHQGHRR